MKKLLILLLFCLPGCVTVNNSDLLRTHYYNASGKYVGYSRTNGYTTYYYDTKGRRIGRSTK